MFSRAPQDGIVSADLFVPGEAQLGAWCLRSEWAEPEQALSLARGDPYVAALDASTVQAPLRVRRWLPGDRFKPLGMDRTQKLQDFFVNQRVPRRRRHRIPLLVSGEDVIWVVGLRIDERVRIRESTVRAVMVAASRPSSEEIEWL